MDMRTSSYLCHCIDVRTNGHEATDMVDVPSNLRNIRYVPLLQGEHHYHDHAEYNESDISWKTVVTCSTFNIRFHVPFPKTDITVENCEVFKRG